MSTFSSSRRRSTHHRTVFTCISIAVAATFTAPILADTWYVPDNYATIQIAIGHPSVNPGDEIIVRNGVHSGGIDFLGKSLWIHSEFGPGSTVITALVPGLPVVTFQSGEGATSILEGFTITGGNIVGGNGGGIRIINSSPTIIDCIFDINSADYGGGMSIESGSPEISGCNFIGNTATINGGGIFMDLNSQPIISGCTFSGNNAVYGGGMFIHASNPDVSFCEFTNNGVTSGGGGL